MYFTNFWGRARLRALPTILGLLPMVSLPFAADPWQSARAGVLALACLIGLRAHSDEVRISAPASGLLGGGALLVAVSALAGKPASSLFGVHGRFDGVVAALVLALVALAGVASGSAAIRPLSKAVGIAAPIVAGVVIYQRLVAAQPNGLSGNPVLAGGWCAIAALVLVAAALGERGAVRAWLAAAALAAGVATALTSSRGALVGLVIGGLLIALVMVTRAGWRKAVVLLVLLAALVGVAVSIAPARFSSTDATAGSAAARLEIWKATVRMVADRPLLGTGAGRYLYVYPSYQTARHALLEPGVRADQAHSVPLHVAATAGVPAALLGGLLLALAFVSAGAKALRGSASGLVVLAGLGAWSGQALFGVSTVEIDGLVWFLGGVAISWLPDMASHLRSTTASRALARSLSPTAAVRTMQGAQAPLMLVVALCAVYITSDVYFEAGRTAYAATDFARARILMTDSIRIEPTTDVRRVGLADAAGMLIATGAPAGAALQAEKTVSAGLALEPRSYDLAYARARMLRDGYAPPERILAAYCDAIRLYPYGAEAASDASMWAEQTGDARASHAIERAITSSRASSR